MVRYAIPLAPNQVRAIIRGELSALWLPMPKQPPKHYISFRLADIGGPWWDGWDGETDATHRVKLPFTPDQECFGQEAFARYIDELDIGKEGESVVLYRADMSAYWPMGGGKFMRADFNPLDHEHKPRWKSSTQMPRELSRITLKVTAVDVRPIQSMTPQEAAAAGLWRMSYSDDADDSALSEAITDYWDGRYGKRPELQFDENPWAIKLDVVTELGT